MGGPQGAFRTADGGAGSRRAHWPCCFLSGKRSPGSVTPAARLLGSELLYLLPETGNWGACRSRVHPPRNPPKSCVLFAGAPAAHHALSWVSVGVRGGGLSAAGDPELRALSGERSEDPSLPSEESLGREDATVETELPQVLGDGAGAAPSVGMTGPERSHACAGLPEPGAQEGSPGFAQTAGSHSPAHTSDPRPDTRTLS